MPPASSSSRHRSQTHRRKPGSSYSPLPTKPSKRTKPSRSKQPYHYDTLDKEKRQIRQFELLPGRKDEQLRGRLMTVDLDTCPDFDAISYVWGNLMPRFALIVDDDKFLEISENLRNALIELRHQYDSRTLWIDAICINQSDVLERNHQVQKMLYIYQNAQTIRAWVGCEHEESDKPHRDLITSYYDPHSVESYNLRSSFKLHRTWNVRKLIDTFGAATPAKTDSISRSRENAMFAMMKSSFDHPTGRQAWKDLSIIAIRPYWSRVWIQQEIATESNVTVHCGHLSFPLASLYGTRFALNQFLDNLQEGAITPIQGLVRQWFAHILFLGGLRSSLDREDYGALRRLLTDQTVKQATDPKDRVYGMTGICRPWRDTLNIDYRLPTESVYVAAFKSAVTRYNHLNLLVDLVRAPKVKRLDGLPSWCPDWSVTINPSYTTYSRTSQQELCLWDIPSILPASIWGHSPLDFHFKDNDNVLVAGGVTLDIIENFTDCFSRDESTFSQNEANLVQDALRLGMSSRGGPYWSFWRSQDATLVCSDQEKHSVASDLAQHCGFPQHHINSLVADQWTAILRTLTANLLPLRPDAPKPMDSSGILTEVNFQMHPIEFPFWYSFSTVFKHPTRHRRFFISQNKFMGLGPSQMQEGDVICVLFNCHLPVVLRKIHDYYTFVGEAYFHGWMEGEVSEGLRAGRLRKQFFEIH